MIHTTTYPGLVETLEHDGKIARIFYDEDGPNPREDQDNLGRMVCWHRRYRLGDVHDWKEPRDFDAYYKRHRRDISVIYPLYLYDHSGITISTRPFACPWDSGQIGYIYTTKEDVREEYNVQRVSLRIRELTKKVLLAEVEEYDNYLRGEVYYIEVTDESGEVCDSCGGFIGEKYALEEARAMIGFPNLHQK